MKNQFEIESQSHNDHEEFESISEKSDDLLDVGQKVLETLPKNYAMTQICFPKPDSKTLQLFQIYAQNNTLIQNLRREISRLEKIKKQQIYLLQSIPKTHYDLLVSEFFLGIQQTYEQRQLQLQKLKKQIKTVDTDRVRILMAKNRNIFKLAQSYFQEFKQIIDIKAYDSGLAILTEQRKRNRKRKENHTNNFQEQIGQLAVRSNSIDSNDSKISGIREMRKQKQKTKPKYLIRLIGYDEVFSELETDKKFQKQRQQYIVQVNHKQVPSSLCYSQQIGIVLVLVKTGAILVYKLGDSETISIKENQSIDKAEQTYPKLRQKIEARLEFDLKLSIQFCQIRKNQLYVLTSDSILRIYEIVLNQVKGFQRFRIINIIYCQKTQKYEEPIMGMAFCESCHDELLFITNTQLCKVNVAKFRSEVLFTYPEKLLSLGPSHLETQTKVFFSTQNFDPIETKLIQKNRLQLQSLNETLLQSQHDCSLQQTFKLCCFQKGQKIYVIRALKNGLLTGQQLDLEFLNHQVQIIETEI